MEIFSFIGLGNSWGGLGGAVYIRLSSSLGLFGLKWQGVKESCGTLVNAWSTGGTKSSGPASSSSWSGCQDGKCEVGSSSWLPSDQRFCHLTHLHSNVTRCGCSLHCQSKRELRSTRTRVCVSEQDAFASAMVIPNTGGLRSQGLSVTQQS
eukprot:1662695-Amphidinium_carterae.1